MESLKIPLDAIIFDCDATLSHIEGINELARQKGVFDEVARITSESMGEAGMSPDRYAARLHLVKPTYPDVINLADLYLKYLAPDAKKFISIMQKLDKAIYIISAGLSLAVIPFGEKLNIKKTNIFSVNIYFDSQGHYQDFDRKNPLVTAEGKKDIVENIKKMHPHVALIGDGETDYQAATSVDRFIGYGGMTYREALFKKTKYYVTDPSFLSFLPLCLTEKEMDYVQHSDFR